jgi:O-acetyl-ADP-ribose deacetylase (regulator of RNase III)
MSKIEYVKGDLLQTSIKHIIHGCNSKGVMGSGVAKAIRDKYPRAYRDYNDSYDSYGLELGSIIVSAQDDSKVIHNAITQRDYGRDSSRVYVSYWAIAEVFRKINSWGIREIALPKIGAGLANGDWNVIEAIIENTLIDTKPYVYVLE